MTQTINMPFEKKSGPELIEQDKIIRFGVLALIIGLGGFIIWAAFVPLAKGVVATGTVVVDGNRRTIQHLEGGIVGAIHVRDGSQVKAGDVLIELDQTQVSAQRDLFRLRYYTNLAMFNRLEAERLGAIEITYSPEILAQENDPQILRIIDVHQNLFEARSSQIEGQTSILEQRISQLKKQIEGLKAEGAARITEAGLITEELTRTESLQKRGLIGMPQVWEGQKALAQAEGAIGRSNADVSAAEVAIGEAQLEIIQLSRTRQEEVANKTLEVQEQVFELKEQLVAVEDVFDRTLIKSPQDGTVFGLQIFTVGGVVPPASPILEIVPTNDRLVVEAQIKITDVDNVIEGMSVRVRFSSFKSRTIPVLNGEIISITADAFKDEQSGESFYLARIGISDDELARINDLTVVPGMPVVVMIEAGNRTAFAYLLDPITSTLRKSLTEE